MYTSMEAETEEHPEHWKAFHNVTREYVIFLLLFIFLYISSYCLISAFKKKIDFYSGTYEDALVYRISLWMSTFSLAVSIGAALLLPISIISNEVLLFYPNSYYVQWLNSSLIQGLWNLVFLFSNVALFILLPFAHLFIESEGFPGSRKGIMARVYEAVLVLALLGLLIMGITFIISALFDDEECSIESVFNVSNYYLPFLYSCVSFLGVLMLLVCTPVGFARLFSVMADLLVKRKLSVQQEPSYHNYKCKKQKDNETDFGVSLSCDYQASMARTPELYQRKNAADRQHDMYCSCQKIMSGLEYRSERYDQTDNEYDGKSMLAVRFEGTFRAAALRKNCGYPFVMLLLLILTTVSVLMVTQNTLELCFGIKNLPIYSQNLSLGISSLSALGPIGAALEIILILYLWCTSIVGLYSLPLFCRLKPELHCTSMTQVIGNCAVLLVLSSALPVLARSLGITNFDLLGDFGRINWLGNFYIVLFHNIIFAVTAAVCLGTKITAGVRRELYVRLCSFSWTPIFSFIYGLVFSV